MFPADAGSGPSLFEVIHEGAKRMTEECPDDLLPADLSSKRFWLWYTRLWVGHGMGFLDELETPILLTPMTDGPDSFPSLPKSLKSLLIVTSLSLREMIEQFREKFGEPMIPLTFAHLVRNIDSLGRPTCLADAHQKIATLPKVDHECDRDDCPLTTGEWTLAQAGRASLEAGQAMKEHATLHLNDSPN